LRFQAPIATPERAPISQPVGRNPKRNWKGLTTEDTEDTEARREEGFRNEPPRPAHLRTPSYVGGIGGPHRGGGGGGGPLRCPDGGGGATGGLLGPPPQTLSSHLVPRDAQVSPHCRAPPQLSPMVPQKTSPVGDVQDVQDVQTDGRPRHVPLAKSQIQPGVGQVRHSMVLPQPSSSLPHDGARSAQVFGVQAGGRPTQKLFSQVQPAGQPQSRSLRHASLMAPQ
jgi:hypothetical protein